MSDPVAKWFMQVFPGQANSLVARYGAPVWLVGSALRSETPRDLDLRIVLADAEMARLYGRDFPKRPEDRTLGSWEINRMRDNLKQSRCLGNWFGLPIDFQVQSEMESLAHMEKPRSRLDTVPDWVILDERFTDYATNFMRGLLGLPAKETT